MPRRKSPRASWAFPAGYRYLECVVPAANTEKFWCYWLSKLGSSLVVHVHYGRIGTNGAQAEPKKFASERVATVWLEGKVTEKLRKGYVARDEAWVQRMWGDWKPPMPERASAPTLDVGYLADAMAAGKESSEALKEALDKEIRGIANTFRVPAPIVNDQRRPEIRKLQRQQRRRAAATPLPSEARPRRVIDFTEDE